MGIDNEPIDLDPEAETPWGKLLGLGPNVTGYPGGYPNGYLQAMERLGYWGPRRLHLCSGSVQDGVTVDVKRLILTKHVSGNRVHSPTVRADLRHGVPFADASFDAVFIDPPYSEEKATELYALPLVNVPALLREAYRVVVPGGCVVILDLRSWAVMRPKGSIWVALHPVNDANRNVKPLRACCVFRKPADPGPAPRGGLDRFA
jgi:SAM-dependent methyltransferase